MNLNENQCWQAVLNREVPSETPFVYAVRSTKIYCRPACPARRLRREPVTYVVTATPLGQMLVAATDKGVCAVTLGDTAEDLEAALHREYSAAALTPDDGKLTEWVQALVRHLAGKQPELSLPLDVQATAFQRCVWQELQRIPSGETRSYSQIAEAIGKPNAARAVASACASNPVALAVPCHRVVRGDGSLSGYRWGIGRKQSLLAQEKAATKPPL